MHNQEVRRRKSVVVPAERQTTKDLSGFSSRRKDRRGKMWGPRGGKQSRRRKEGMRRRARRMGSQLFFRLACRILLAITRFERDASCRSCRPHSSLITNQKQAAAPSSQSSLRLFPVLIFCSFPCIAIAPSPSRTLQPPLLQWRFSSFRWFYIALFSVRVSAAPALFLFRELFRFADPNTGFFAVTDRIASWIFLR